MVVSAGLMEEVRCESLGRAQAERKPGLIRSLFTDDGAATYFACAIVVRTTKSTRVLLHLSEQMQVASAHGQHFAASLHVYVRGLVDAASDVADCLEVHDD